MIEKNPDRRPVTQIEDRTEFSTGAESPLIPMGAITGRPSREDLRGFLEAYHRAGVNNFLIYPRSGLEVEYMGDEWLEICRHIIEYCAEHGMSVWLYDEYNWPSGKCRGKVIRRNPDFASKKLVAFADRNFCGVEDANAPADEYFWTEIDIPLYTDLLDPDAVSCFIETTHEVYYRHFKKYFGSVIKGIFSDEPSYIYASFQPVQGAALELPIYRGLEDDYRNATGRELKRDLEDSARGKDSYILWKTFFTLMGDKFRKVYLSRIRNWCEEHGILSTGHLINETPPRISMFSSGAPIKSLLGFSMPGIDDIWTEMRFEHFPFETFKLAESSIRHPGAGGLAELFAFGPSDLSFTRMRAMIYLCAMHKIDHYVLAVSVLDARGNYEKPGYFNPTSPMQPSFRHMAQFNADAAEAAKIAKKSATRTIAVRYPETGTAMLFDLRHEKPECIPLIEVIRTLASGQWEFDLIEEDASAGQKYDAVFSVFPEKITEEVTKSEFSSLTQILPFLEKHSRRAVEIRDIDGEMPGCLAIKSYDDGTCCVINLSEKRFSRLACKSENFDLDPFGVQILPMKCARFDHVIDLINAEFKCTCENIATHRIFFNADGLAAWAPRWKCSPAFAVRQFGGKVSLAVNGRSVCADRPADLLPQGLRGLYHATDEQEYDGSSPLVLSLTTPSKDQPYLPSVIGLQPPPEPGADGLCGTAAEIVDGALSEYAGDFLLETVADLSGCDGLKFQFRNLAVELFLEEKSLGAKLWAPFIWAIPDALQKPNVKATIRVSTSIGPLFGNYSKYAGGHDPYFMEEYRPGQQRYYI